VLQPFGSLFSIALSQALGLSKNSANNKSNLLRKRAAKLGLQVAVRSRLKEFLESQVPVIEQALEIAALMLGSDKSRG
jgi:hypothetical protein